MGRILIFLLFLSCFGFILAACPTGTITSLTDSTKCYLISPQKQSFLVAEQTCVKNNGHLTSVHSIFENEYIKEEARVNFTGDSSSDSLWIGLQDLVIPGTWNWLDGSSFDFNDWGKGEPQKITGADCGALKLQGGAWGAEDCDNQKSFVCLIIVPGPTSTTTTTTTKTTTTTIKPYIACPVGWSLYEKTNSCYFVGVNKTWTDAERWCNSYGAHLTSLHSFDENKFVSNLIPFDPNANGCGYDQYAWIGLHLATQDVNNWSWSDGSLLNFTSWAPSKPYYSTSFSCATFRNELICGFPADTWIDTVCDGVTGFYVCKKDAISV